jgi:hypothetical protein
MISNPTDERRLVTAETRRKTEEKQRKLLVLTDPAGAQRITAINRLVSQLLREKKKIYQRAESGWSDELRAELVLVRGNRCNS